MKYYAAGCLSTDTFKRVARWASNDTNKASNNGEDIENVQNQDCARNIHTDLCVCVRTIVILVPLRNQGVNPE